MSILRSLKSKILGKDSATKEEIVKMIQELEIERKKFKPNSIMDRRITDKTGILLELAERLEINLG